MKTVLIVLGVVVFLVVIVLSLIRAMEDALRDEEQDDL